MENNDKIELIQEYVKKLQKCKYWILRASGYGRFSISNNRIVEKSFGSVIYGVFVLIISIVVMTHLMYATAIRDKVVSYLEVVISMEVSVIVYLLVINISFGNKSNMVKMIEHSCEIDVLLGIKETRFMRDIADTAYSVMGLAVFIFHLTVITPMWFIYDATIWMHVMGHLFFLWEFLVFYDVNYLLTHSTFLNLRARYMNVALMKALKVKVQYIPDLFIFNGLFWKSKHNDVVNIQGEADVMKFVKVYKMFFAHLELFEKCYQCTIFTGILCISVGALSSVQALIIYGKTEMDTLKKYILISWLVLSWLYFVGMSVLVDIFSRQIEQTKLICTYAQLKYINNEAVYQFTKPILRALEVRVARTSIYGLFFFDPGAMLRIAASTFLYFTVQIQFSMPAEEIGNSGNVTNTDCVEVLGKL